MINNRNIDIEENTIDLKKILGILFKNWFWFALSFLFFFTGAFFWNHYSTPIYEVEAKILINEEGSTFMDPQMMISQVFTPNTYKVKKEMQVLGSYSLTLEALHKLPVEANWWVDDGFSSDLLYPPPYRVLIDSARFQSDKIEISLVQVDSARVSISYIQDESELVKCDTVSFNEFIDSPFFRFKIIPNSQLSIGSRYKFKLNKRDDLVKYFNRIELFEEKYSSTITLKFRDVSVPRAVDFVDALSQAFLNKGVSRKNLIALNTINFIENQLESVVDSLRFSEERLEEFRRLKGATNLDYQSKKVYELLDGLERERAQYTVFLNYYDYLQKSITQNLELNKLVVPSSMGISDELLNKLVLELIQFYSEKAEITVNSKKDNPLIGAIDYKIEDRKRTILETIDGLINSARIALKNVDERINKYQGEVAKIPEKEKELLSFQRSFKLNDEIYTFLLTKRSELQIASASNFPENEVLDGASAQRAKVVSPNKRLNFLIAIFFGTILPFIVIYLRSQFLDKFEEYGQVENLGFPIIGELIHSDNDKPFIVKTEHNSIFTDSYRLLRTNIKFLIGGGQSKVILVTSTFSGEGKSYVSRNIAASFAQAGHKTILINCDLRKPEKEFFNNLPQEKGLSAYLSYNSTYEEMISPSEVENLWFISSGLVPPNATELIDSPRMLELLETLRNEYEIIVIDSPPIGIVADSYVIAQQSDLLLFVVRFKHSRISGVQRILSSISQKEFKKVAIVANDLSTKYFGYGYYGYNYGYGYHYGQSKKKK